MEKQNEQVKTKKRRDLGRRESITFEEPRRPIQKESERKQRIDTREFSKTSQRERMRENSSKEPGLNSNPWREGN